jgi:hypothetical protein
MQGAGKFKLTVSCDLAGSVASSKAAQWLLHRYIMYT